VNAELMDVEAVEAAPYDGAPRSAYEAADLLLHEGHHVHFVAEGESICYSWHCPPGLHVSGRPAAADRPPSY
jgi:hypothetical protein